MPEPVVLDSHRTHLRTAVQNAALVTEPAPYMVLEKLLPPDVYQLLLETMPPPEGFEVADKVKANFDPFNAPTAPTRSCETWMWLQRVLVDDELTPLLVDRFRQHLTSSYEALFGAQFASQALAMPQRAFRGRLMLRRPGYRLQPHRDMKNATMTVLIYFARPGDSADYGTDLYRIDNDREAPFMKTYYPESAGGHATLAHSVPFVANSALVFLNAPGMAHGAAIPATATQAERYAYQFYIGPPKAELRRLVEQMPVERQSTWRSRGDE